MVASAVSDLVKAARIFEILEVRNDVTGCARPTVSERSFLALTVQLHTAAVRPGQPLAESLSPAGRVG